MIVDWFWHTLDGVSSWFLGLFGTWALPSWFTGFSGLLGQVLAGAAGMGVWIPWSILFLALTLTFSLWGIGLLIKFARWILGLLPTMGGG